MVKVFIAYAAEPEGVGQTIERAKEKAGALPDVPEIKTWAREDLGGAQLIAPIIEAIEWADIVVADITRLNFNVTYELGYAIGLGKRVLPVRNIAFELDRATAELVGIYDTILDEKYATAQELLNLICAAQPGRRFATEFPPDPLPMYVLLPPVRDDDANDILELCTKAGLRPNTFDPSERVRLAATDAVRSVAAAAGVVVPLLSEEMTGAQVHNLRAAFIAGISHSLQKPTRLLQKGTWPAPLDVRDATTQFVDATQLRKVIQEFAEQVHEYWFSVRLPSPTPSNKLAALNIGDPAAENEEPNLTNYFLERDEFRQVLDGRAHVVIGRKGSGKTAVFFQVRDRLRSDRFNVIVDLNPEAHQLRRLKDVILTALDAGGKQFLLAGFWEYVLLLEVCAKILEKDRDVHKRNHNLFEPYQRLLATFSQETAMSAGSFSARLLRLIDRIGERYTRDFANLRGVDLSDDNLTNILYETTISKLREQVIAYAGKKGIIYVLFDNIDKGWNATGLEEEDIIIIRSLLDAARKLGNDFRRTGADFRCAVFLRNDIYDLLLSNTPDRGKETRVLIDWVQPDLFRHLVGRRLRFGLNSSASTDQLWYEICVPLVDGEHSLDYLIRHSLRRPRFLLSLINYCKGIAVNFGRDRIDAEDIARALSIYSTDITTEIGLEMRDVMPACDQILYVFLGEPREMPLSQVFALLGRKLAHEGEKRRAFALLLWHGVLGIKRPSGVVAYIYDVNYDHPKLAAIMDKSPEADPTLQINPAFWPNFESTPVA